MIARLTGKVIDRQERALIVDINGLGYRVMVPTVVKAKTAVGKTVSLRIHHHLSEGEEALYGFATDDYLRQFELLLTVPSIGVRTAMNILEVAPPDVLAQAVAEGDRALLTKVSGVGRKTADRILIELKEKLPAPRHKSLPGTLQQEVIEALVSIGYTPGSARLAVGKLPKRITTVEEAVRAVLQHQGKSHG